MWTTRTPCTPLWPPQLLPSPCSIRRRNGAGSRARRRSGQPSARDGGKNGLWGSSAVRSTSNGDRKMPQQRTACHERRARARTALGRQTREECAVRQTQEAQWRDLWAARHATLERRRHDDAAWRQERRRLREQLPPLVSKRAWIAILVVTDNCTRQCLGLPLFVAGPKITAALVISASRALLPVDLQFLISDRGTHVTARDFARFTDEHGFVHVLVARHRPQSNGIAERFVRTLKEWLAAHTWADADALAPLLDAFLHEYNVRPHQGLALPGLSPDEFARRLWLL